MAQPGPGSTSASASNNPLKRPRTNSIDESNATARHFTGHAQLMNRWKALAADSSPLSHSASTSRLPHSTGLVRARPGLTRAVTASSPIRSDHNPPQSPLQSTQSTPIEPSTRSLTLPTTSIAPRPPTSTAQVPMPSSTVLISQAKGPAVSRGLPSPAPSDENTSSPLIPTNSAPLLQQTTRAANPADTLSAQSPTTLSYDLPVWQAHQAPPQRHGPSPLQQHAPQQIQPRRVSVPATPLQASNRRILPSNQIHDMTIATPRRPASVTVAPPPLLSGQHNIPVRFDRQAMDNSVMNLERQIRDLQHPTQQHHTELSRLYILRQAILHDDWFYLILHQLNCLRTVAPTSLPDNIKRLGDRPFRCLESLLSSNARLNQNFLHWSSQFPLAIMDFYSNDNLRDGYRETALHVENFLAALGQHWDRVRQCCQIQGAPPLFQEMVSVLHLPSVVLQGILFKSIGRIVLGMAPDTEEVLNALDQLHAADRRWHQAGGNRNPQQVNLAINAMIGAFKEGCNYVRARRMNQLPAGMIFQVPLQIRNIINPLMFPLSIQPPPPRQQNVSNTSNTNTDRTPGSAPLVSDPPRPPIARYMFPRRGEPSRSQPMHPDPNRAALHQARARSPALRNDIPEGSPGLYRYVEAFVMAPTRLNADKFCRDIEFEVTQQLFNRLPKTVLNPHTGRRQRELSTKSLSIRLKCVKNAQTPVNGQTEWFSRDGVWPENTYFNLNEQCLETRGKLHWGKYLPIDITDFVKLGTNKVGVAINRERKDKSPYDYLLAVELVVTNSHDQIHEKLQPLSRDDSMASMQASLVNDFDDDDDVAVVSSVLTIDILDPIAGTGICKVPVRGKECKHRNCFDLDVFLMCVKRETAGAPSAVDVWKCPICRGDVRPTMLIKDEFLTEVRQELTTKSVAARSIIVEADGTWKPMEESKKGVRSSSLEREETAKVTKHIEVVELD